MGWGVSFRGNILQSDTSKEQFGILTVMVGLLQAQQSLLPSHHPYYDDLGPTDAELL